MKKHVIKDRSIGKFLTLITGKSAEERDRANRGRNFPGKILALRHDLPFDIAEGDTVTFEVQDVAQAIDLPITAYLLYKAEAYDDLQFSLKLIYKGLVEPNSWDHDNNNAIDSDDLPF